MAIIRQLVTIVSVFAVPFPQGNEILGCWVLYF